MYLVHIINAIQTERVNITQHARREARNDDLTLDEIFFSTLKGEVIENYPTDTPYPSCLIYGKTIKHEPVHTVWAYAAESQIGILITVYRPDPDLWINWKERK
ncbi:MAG: hypothetical protein MAG431_01278 [Chloroflexi bacterium]|nr:hypothetical protein [Chloroflexota bacterium]